MEFQLLGPLEIRGDQGRAPIAGNRSTALIVALLMRPNRVVPVDHLIESAWGDDPPRRVSASVQTRIFQLRKSLGEAEADGGRRISTTPAGYLLRVDPGELDLEVFRARRAAARKANGMGALDQAATELRAGLALWRGPALAGAEGEFARKVAAGLDEERLDALEERIEVDLARGQAGAVLAELQDLVGAHPRRERLHGQLMLALYRTGRRDEAFQAFRAAEQILVDELGIEPGPELQELHRRLLADDPALTQHRPAVTVESRSRPVPHQLPADVYHFTGRSEHLNALAAVLDQADADHPAEQGAADRAEASTAVVITAIDGTAGVGKTALAVHFGHRIATRFPDGQLYVNLRGFDPQRPPVPATDALGQFLRALDVDPHQVPLELDEQVMLYQSITSTKRMLVVLDNAADTDQVRPLLPSSPSCFTLVTSRSRLTDLVTDHDAHQLTLGLLTPEEAIALLVRVLGRERVDAEPEAAAELVRLCARLPLAVSIAASNLAARPDRSIAETVSALAEGNRLAALQTGDDELAAVRAAFDLSYHALKPDSRYLFRCLGLVPGPDFTPDAAAALTGLPVAETSTFLRHLVTVHLVEQHAPGRFRLHDLLRLYAQDMAHAEDGDHQCDRAQRRLFEWYLHSADNAVGLVSPEFAQLSRPPVEPSVTPVGFATDTEAVAWLEAERPNLVTAAQHAAGSTPHHAVAWHLADVLHGFVRHRRYHDDWRTVAKAGLEAAIREGDRQAQAAMHHSVSSAHWSRAQYQLAIDHEVRALALSREVAWPQGEAVSLNFLGHIHKELGDTDQAVDYYTRAIAINRANGFRQGETQNLFALGAMSWQRGRIEQSIAYYEQALVIDRELGSTHLEHFHLGCLGSAERDFGEHARAAEHLRQSLAFQRETGARDLESYLLDDLSALSREIGRFQDAFDQASAALAIAVDIDDLGAQSDAHNSVAHAHLCLGRLAEAVEHFQTSLRICQDTGYAYGEALALAGLAVAELRLGRLAEASTHADKALALTRRTGYRLLEGLTLTHLAAIHLARGELAQARGFARQALAIHEESGHRLDRARTLRVLGQVCEATGNPTEAVAHWRQALALFGDVRIPEADDVRERLAEADRG
ncbi:AfsR/SARP family transcriptional regulator [Goodfellowiella coeruleoviolacea]|uniref:DNA-binding transcriptional activator of the SARP family n=1 Tax=Goodfellowiella coeruleoviolacea TaxID=334858 RepID=A0AAE3GBC0_9PSEU|nr:BTAD domain-containing putative transcriptional regulator [Goodfellowiella coeruleoviolacea]MCP2164142.1 DNA-binding transcriptional activator of the SARP family [Goodfellowiella coeruleoviolacea]